MEYFVPIAFDQIIIGSFNGSSHWPNERTFIGAGKLLFRDFNCWEVKAVDLN